MHFLSLTKCQCRGRQTNIFVFRTAKQIFISQNGGRIYSSTSIIVFRTAKQTFISQYGGRVYSSTNIYVLRTGIERFVLQYGRRIYSQEYFNAKNTAVLWCGHKLSLRAERASWNMGLAVYLKSLLSPFNHWFRRY